MGEGRIRGEEEQAPWPPAVGIWSGLAWPQAAKRKQMNHLQQDFFTQYKNQKFRTGDEAQW